MQADTIEGRPPFALPFLVFAFLNFLDAYMTRLVLMLPGTSEANPVMAAMFADGLISALMFKVAMVGLVGLISFLLWDRKYIRRILSAATALMLFVVAYQLYNVFLHLRFLNDLLT